MPRWNHLLFLLLVLLPFKAFAQTPEFVLDATQAVDILQGVNGLYYADPKSQQSIDLESSLVPSRNEIPGFLAGLTPVKKFNILSSGGYWFHAVLSNPTQVENWVLNPSAPPMERIEIFLYGQDGVKNISRGLKYIGNYSSPYGVYFDLESSQNIELLVYIESGAFSSAPSIEVSTQEIYKSKISIDNLLLTGCFGAIGILCLYNAFIGFSTKDKSFIFYSAYLLTVLVAWCFAFGMVTEWYRWVDITTFRAPFFLSITFNILYYNYFLELPKRHPLLSKSSFFLAAISFLLAFTPSYFSALQYMLICGVISALWIINGLISGIYSYISGYKPARYFILAFLVLFVAVGLLLIVPFLPDNSFKNGYVITLIAQTLDMLLLSLALADRINIFREQKESALNDLIAVKNDSILLEHESKVKLQKALDLSEEESRRKAEFLRMMSHELRTPLHSIVSSVDQWDEDQEFSMKTDLINFIGYGAFRLKSQVDNLVLFAETDEANLQPSCQNFEIRPLLEKLCVGVAGLVHERVDFHYLPSEVSGKNEIPRGFHSDAYLIEHLIRSVLENACKYTEYGRVDFIVSWSDEESALKIDILDTGCGMTAEQQKNMFNAFVQVSRGLERKSEGLGLGLTICCRLSDILNADLVIESESSVGTNVHISLPLKVADIDAFNRRQITEQLGRVLIVEDNQINADILSHIIVSLGQQVAVVVSGQEALKQLDQENYDMILMDIQMPVMDGITATRWMRQRGITEPIIAITANSDSRVRQRCIEAGMNDLVVKPVRRRDIKRIIEKYMPNTRKVLNE